MVCHSQFVKRILLFSAFAVIPQGLAYGEGSVVSLAGKVEELYNALNYIGQQHEIGADGIRRELVRKSAEEAMKYENEFRDAIAKYKANPTGETLDALESVTRKTINPINDIQVYYAVDGQPDMNADVSEDHVFELKNEVMEMAAKIYPCG